MKLFVLSLFSLLILGACSSMDRVNLQDTTGVTPDSEIGPEGPNPGETPIDPEVPNPDDSIDWTPIEPGTPVPEPEAPKPIVPEVPKVKMLKGKLLVKVVNSSIKVFGEISADGRIFNFGEHKQYEYTTRYENNDYSKGIMVSDLYQATGVFNKPFSYDAKNNTVNIHTDDGGIFQLIDSK